LFGVGLYWGVLFPPLGGGGGGYNTPRDENGEWLDRLRRAGYM
jgi:hypothetical protein